MRAEIILFDLTVVAFHASMYPHVIGDTELDGRIGETTCGISTGLASEIGMSLTGVITAITVDGIAVITLFNTFNNAIATQLGDPDFKTVWIDVTALI